MSLDAMMRMTADLQRHTVSKDTSGGMLVSPWTVVTAGFSCDIQPAHASTIQRYGQFQIEVSHTIFTVDNAGALTNDRVQITDPDTGNIRTFKVQGDQKKAPGYIDWPYMIDVIEDPQS